MNVTLCPNNVFYPFWFLAAVAFPELSSACRPIWTNYLLSTSTAFFLSLVVMVWITPPDQILYTREICCEAVARWQNNEDRHSSTPQKWLLLVLHHSTQFPLSKSGSEVVHFRTQKLLKPFKIALKNFISGNYIHSFTRALKIKNFGVINHHAWWCQSSCCFPSVRAAMMMVEKSNQKMK